MDYYILKDKMLECVVSTAYSIVHCEKLHCRYNKHIYNISQMANGSLNGQDVKINRTTARMLAYAMARIIKASPMAIYNEQRRQFIQLTK